MSAFKSIYKNSSTKDTQILITQEMPYKKSFQFIFAIDSFFAIMDNDLQSYRLLPFSHIELLLNKCVERVNKLR